MSEGHGFVWQFQHGSRHVVNCGHLAGLHHLTNAVTSRRTRVDPDSWLKEVAAQAQSHQTGGRLHIQHAGTNLPGEQNKISCYFLIQRKQSAFLKNELNLIPLFVAWCLFWLHVEKVHLASEGGQEGHSQSMFGHLQYQNMRSEIGHANINICINEERRAILKQRLFF